MRRFSLNDVATVVLAVCALTVTVLVVRRQFVASPAQAQAAAPRYVRNWRELAAHGHLVAGIPDAPVAIVEFADFQCPFCRKVRTSLDTVFVAHPNQVELIFREFPLPAHLEAHNAALAAECAASQHKFRQYYGLLFDRPRDVANGSFTRLARESGMADTSAFAVCMKSEVTAAALAADIDAGEKLGIRGTPTLVINGAVVVGALPARILDSVITGALRHVAVRGGVDLDGGS